jgi:hypothetical protein
MKTNCTTHHNACDCREESFSRIKDDLIALKKELHILEDGLDWCCDVAWSDDEGCFVEDVATMLKFMRHRVKRLLLQQKQNVSGMKKTENKQLTDRLRGIHKKN